MRSSQSEAIIRAILLSRVSEQRAARDPSVVGRGSYLPRSSLPLPTHTHAAGGRALVAARAAACC